MLIKTEDDVDSAVRFLKNKFLGKLNRIYIFKKNIKVFFDEKHSVCVIKYANDVVPLFIFTDEQSIFRLKKAILEEQYDGSC